MNTNLNFGKLIQSFIFPERNNIKPSVLPASLQSRVIPPVKIPGKKKRSGDSILNSLLPFSTSKNGSTFFIKKICAGIHSISFDDSGFMYIGSLGNNPAEIGKRGLKKIFKIDPTCKITEIAQIDCQFITSITSASKDILFVATLENQKGKVYKITNSSEVNELASGFSEISTLKMDTTGNLIVGSDKIYMINPDGERSVFLPDSGTVDFGPDFEKLFIGSIDGNELYCYSIKDKSSYTAHKVFESLKGIKCLSVSPNGKIIVLSYDERDLLTIIDKGKVLRQINICIDLPMIYLPRRYILSNMAIGKKGFDENAAYITTWTGDIIKVNTDINLIN